MNCKFSTVLFLFLAAFKGSWSQEYEDGHQKSIGIGIGGGVYIPMSSETKELLGSTWWNYVITPMSDSIFTDQLVFSWDLDILNRSSNDNRILAIKPGVVIRKQFGDELSKIVPYIDFTAGPVYYDYAFIRSGDRIASKKFGVGGSAEIGFKINKRLTISVKGSLYNAPDKLNLNGLGLNVLYKLF